MKRISMKKRILATLLSLSLLCGMLLAGAVLPAAAEEATDWDYEHTMSKSAEAWDLTEFTGYSFAKLNAKSSVLSNDSATWGTGWYGALNNSILKDNSAAASGNWGVLTYNVDTMKDFEVAFTIPDAYARQGIIFGGDLGVMPVSGDDDYTNDTGVILTYEDRQMVAGGAIETDTHNHGDLPGMKVSQMTVRNSAFVAPGSSVDFATMHTYHAKVENGTLTVWVEGEEDLVKTIALSENYKGGYLSFFTNSNQCGFSSIKIKKLSDAEEHEWDYAHEMTAKRESWPLDAHFSAYMFADGKGAEGGVYALSDGPMAPSTSLPYNDTISKTAWLTEAWGSYNTGWLKPMKSGGYQVLTYNTKTFKDFELEVTMAASYGKQGIIFGSDIGEIGVTLDNDHTNDTGVIVRLESSKALAFAGAVDLSSWNGSTSHSDFTGAAIVNATVSANNANAVQSNEELNTFRIKVDGKRVTVWDVDEPELAKTFRLNNNYAGGYISYYSDGPSQSALASFKVKALPPHVCDYTEENYDDEGHWNECECGEKDLVTEHDLSYAYDGAEGHYQVCDCGYTTETVDHDFANVCDTLCDICAYTRTVPDHVYSNDCDVDCNECGDVRTVPDHVYDIPKYDENGHWNECDCGEVDQVLPHVYDNACDTTCDCGNVREVEPHKYSNACDKSCNKCNATRTVSGHNYKKVVVSKATTSKDGKYKNVCEECGYTASKQTTIYKASSIKLSTTSYTYDGKTKKPSVTIKDSKGKTISTSNYTVTYASGRKYVGKYKVTVKFKGNYTGSKTLYFTINPAKTTVKSLTAGTKKLTVNITKKSSQVTGYQIQYSTSKKFTSAKTKTVSSYKTTKATLSSLKAKTTYYVRVRTYKTVSGVKYYSGWSTYKYKKTK